MGQQSRWLSSEAIESRRGRRRLERHYRKTKSETDRIAYRSACRVTNNLINDSRKNYVRNRLADATGNSRQRWQIANELLHRDHRDKTTPEITPARCETFSQFFVTKLSAIAHTINNQLSSLCLPLLPAQTFHKSPILNAFRPVTVSEVQRIIAKIPVKTSPLDCVPITLVKSCGDVFSVLLARLTNLSFAENVFPSRFKLGQITPILKKQGLAVDDPSSYVAYFQFKHFR